MANCNVLGRVQYIIYSTWHSRLQLDRIGTSNLFFFSLWEGQEGGRGEEKTQPKITIVGNTIAKPMTSTITPLVTNYMLQKYIPWPSVGSFCYFFARGTDTMQGKTVMEGRGSLGFCTHHSSHSVATLLVCCVLCLITQTETESQI